MMLLKKKVGFAALLSHQAWLIDDRWFTLETLSATEEHRKVVELLTEAMVGILQAVQQLKRKTSKDSG